MHQHQPHGSLVLIRDGEDLSFTAKILRNISVKKLSLASLCILSAGRRLSEEEQKSYRSVFYPVRLSKFSVVNLLFAVDAFNPKYLDRVSRADIVILLTDKPEIWSKSLAGSAMEKIFMQRYQHDENFLLAGVNEAAKIFAACIADHDDAVKVVKGLGFLPGTVYFGTEEGKTSFSMLSLQQPVVYLAADTAIIHRKGLREKQFTAADFPAGGGQT